MYITKQLKSIFCSISIILIFVGCSDEPQPNEQLSGHTTSVSRSYSTNIPATNSSPSSKPPLPPLTPQTPSTPTTPQTSPNTPKPSTVVADANALKELSKDQALERFKAIKTKSDELNAFFMPVGNTSLGSEEKNKVAENLSAVLASMTPDEMKRCLREKCLDFEPIFTSKAKFTAILDALGESQAELFLLPFLETAFELRPDTYIGVFMQLLQSIDGMGAAVEKALFNKIIKRISKEDLANKYITKDYSGWSATPGIFKFINNLIAFALDNNRRQIYQDLEKNNSLFLFGALNDKSEYYKKIFTIQQKNKLLTWADALAKDSINKWNNNDLLP